MRTLPALFVLSVIVLAQLSACSKLVPVRPEQQAPLSTDHWQARGKFVFRSATVRESGNFHWWQAGDRYQLRLFGPLGMGAVRVSGDPQLVRIQTRDQDISSDQPTSLLYRVTGLKIPLASMPRWLLGETASDNPKDLSLDVTGQPRAFEERGWRLEFGDRVSTESAPYPMPASILALQGEVSLRLLLRHLDFGPAQPDWTLEDQHE